MGGIRARGAVLTKVVVRLAKNDYCRHKRMVEFVVEPIDLSVNGREH